MPPSPAASRERRRPGVATRQPPRALASHQRKQAQSICPTLNDFLRLINPYYRDADDFAQAYLSSAKGAFIRRLFVSLDFSRFEVTGFFKLFMAIDTDNGGSVTLKEFFHYLNTDVSPFMGKAFSTFNSHKSQGRIKLEPDEWMVGLLNYCLLTPEALAKFSFDLYDGDGSGVISRDELVLMVADLSGVKGNRDVNIDQILSLIDEDGDGDIEYDEWRKVLVKAVSVLKPAILLQTVMQERTFGRKWWDKTKSRMMPKLSEMGHPNLLQFYKRECQETPNRNKQDSEEDRLGKKAEMLADKMYDIPTGKHEKGKKKKKKKGGNDEDDDEKVIYTNEHGLPNPFRSKTPAFGSVLIIDEDDDDFDDDSDLASRTTLSTEELAELAIQDKISRAPVRREDGALVYPDGRVVEALLFKGGKTKSGNEGDPMLTKAEKKIKDKEYRNKIASYAKSRIEQLVAEHDLFDDHLNRADVQSWQLPLRLGNRPETTDNENEDEDGAYVDEDIEDEIQNLNEKEVEVKRGMKEGQKKGWRDKPGKYRVSPE